LRQIHKEKTLIFSQSLIALDVLESFLKDQFQYELGSHYYRLDGSTASAARQRDIGIILLLKRGLCCLGF